MTDSWDIRGKPATEAQKKRLMELIQCDQNILDSDEAGRLIAEWKSRKICIIKQVGNET